MKKLLFFVVLCLFSRMGFAEYTTLHLIGDASESKWENVKAIPMESNGNGIFSWTGRMWSGQFKFMLNKGVWADSFVATLQQNEPVVFGSTHALAFEASGGNDYKFYLNQGGIVNILVDTENLTMKATLLSPLISPSSDTGKGKRIMNIYGCNGRTGDGENPYKLLLGRNSISGTADKWCDTASDQWVILSLSGIYSISEFGFRDGHYKEPSAAKNLDGYKVYVSTTGVEAGDWTEVINESGLDQALNEKYKTLSTPVEARYIKFVPVKAAGDNYIRIFGIDVYGEYVRPINPEIISTGKTIVDYSVAKTGRETSANILDGNLVASASLTGVDMVNPWAFFRQASWAIIDLEETYPIAKFVLTDSEDWINGYKVSVCNSLAGTPEWNVVFDGTFTKELVSKEAVLSTPVEARYVKLEVSTDNQNGWTRIREFEVYKASPAVPTGTLEKSFYVDFGSTTPTVGADANGHYWTNVLSNTAGTNYDMIPSDNATPDYKLELVGPFSLNTSSPGALTDPDKDLLGDLAIASATGDYLHIENRNVGRIKIKNLDQTKAYKFYVFGSRFDTGTRTSVYSFTGLNNSHGTQVTSGTGIAAGNFTGDRKNQNDSQICVSGYVFPDSKGEIVFAASNINSLGHINAMKIEEYSDVQIPDVEGTLSSKMYFDFGGASGSTSVQTVGPDVNSNYWNNITGNTANSSFDLITSANVATASKLVITKGFSLNTGGAGGLGSISGSTQPDAALLGDLAIKTATQDYFYVENAGTTSGFKITNLDRNKAYRFSIFGSRFDTEDRSGVITLTGTNKTVGVYQMAVKDLGVGTALTNDEKNQNTSHIFVSDLIYPDANGDITFEMTNRASKNFAHINAMKVEEFRFGAEVIKATSIELSGADIALLGATSQITATILPENASPMIINWSVDDEEIATINNTGLLTPLKDGKVFVTASITYGENEVVTSEPLEINISGQNATGFSLFKKMYLDFGTTANLGALTVNPDKNNNYWNNIVNTQSGLSMTPLNSYNLISTSNDDLGYVLEITKAFRTNEGGGGGLTNPDVNLLGDMAIATATQDYFYVEGFNSTFKIKNLDKTRPYKFYAFGSRAATSDSDSRITKYTFTGASQSIGTLQVVGNANGLGNTGNFYVTDFIYPDANGEIGFEMVNTNSTFGYINMMKIEEYVDGPIIKPTSITLSGDNITTSGQTSQIVATILPEGAIHGAIKWKVNDTSIASIDNKGLLSPKKNGKVTVTATIDFDGGTLSNEIEVNISGQLGGVNMAGSALNETEAVDMHMITNLDGMITNNFEVYASLKGNGSFTFSRDLGNGNAIHYGAGATAGTLLENGNPIQTAISGPVRITINLTDKTYTILPITSLNIVGSSAPGGSDVTKGSPLTYQGNAVWSAKLSLNSGDPSFYFVINKTAQETLKRITGTNSVISQTQASQFSIGTENIRTNMNGGEYEVSVDLRNYTYSVSCGEVNDLKISYMGSSVASGSGAQSNLGWAYMYTNLLKQRYADGQGLNWTTSNISIGGNTTTNLLDRWERDLLSNCSSYVIYGLSLGNEGIHERGEPAYISYHDGMLKAIQQARDAGIFPVMANNYTRADFNASDYNYVKKLNLLIHEWDLPSINTLGAIDDGAGHWASGYENDNAHPNTAGHEEFYYAMVPSLFDALEAGKPLPARVSGTSYKLGKSVTAERIEFTPENIVHPFTVSFDIKTTTAGTIAWFENETGNGSLKINSEGKLVYESPKKGSIISASAITTGDWKRITLTHYYAWGITVLYINDTKAGELYEKLAPKTFALGGTNAPAEIDYRELFFWRAGMNAEEIQYVNAGKMMKSSLEIYAPLGGTEPMVNLAQSTNTLKLANSSQNLDRKMFFDFGPTTNLGAITPSPDKNGNYWNNITGNTTTFSLDLVSSMNEATGYKLEITKDFSLNAAGAGGLTTPDAELLGDLAIGTATQDYLYAEGKNATFKIKNLDPEKTYKFYVFGSRLGTSDSDSRKSQYTFTGTNSSQGILQTTGLGKVQNTGNVFTSGLLIPNASGEINFELVNSESNFGYLNAMKMEEYSMVYPEGGSPLISVTPADGLGVRIARIYSNTGGFTNETAENLLLDKNIAANKNKKWCYNASDHSVVIELSDYYDVDKFVIDDCKTRENNPNFPEYYIYVSTTGTADGDWKEVVHEVNQADVMYKIKEIAPTKARYIKFVPKGITTIRIFGFQIYGRKSFDSAHAKELISVGKPVIEQQTSPDIQRAAVALFDADKTADNSKWSTATGDKYVVVDLKDKYAVSEFKLYDAHSVNTTNQNIDGYKISVSSDLSAWETVVDATGKATVNIKSDVLPTAKDARYVKLEIPESRMGSEKKVNLYEFEVYGKLSSSQNDADLVMLKTTAGTITPGFDPARTNYTLTVAKEVDKITIQAAARNESAVISTGDLGEKTLQLGENHFPVTVTAADQVTKKTYYLTVTRTKKSSLAELKSLTIDGVELVPVFSPSNLTYRTGVNATSVNVVATAGSTDAVVNGAGQQALSDGANYLTVSVTSEDGSKHIEYNLTVYNTKNLISVSSADGKGKRIANVDSYSGMTGVGENPFRMIRGWKENLSGDTQMKWCDTSTGSQSWIIFSLADIYTINRIEFRDCKMVEKDWPNISQYSVYVSTTDTTEGCWTQVVNESGVAGIDEKVKSFDPVDARFVKFVATKPGNAIRVYGFDIYGTFKGKINRGGNIAVGKTIVNYSACTNDMLTPANILDGREGPSWEFARAVAYVVVDLEVATKINKFVVVDSEAWINGYKVSISDTGNGTDWKEVAVPEFSETTLARKEVTLSAPELTRYVRLDIPRANQLGTNHLKEFEIYEWDGTGIEQPESLSTGNFVVYPNPVARGEKIFLNESGLVKIYSVQGQFVFEQNTNGSSAISTRSLTPGSYIIHLINDRGTKQAKLLVK